MVRIPKTRHHHTSTHILSLSPPASLHLSLSLSLARSRALSLSHTHTHTSRALPHSLPHPLSSQTLDFLCAGALKEESNEYDVYNNSCTASFTYIFTTDSDSLCAGALKKESNEYDMYTAEVLKESDARSVEQVLTLLAFLVQKHKN